MVPSNKCLTIYHVSFSQPTDGQCWLYTAEASKGRLKTGKYVLFCALLEHGVLEAYRKKWEHGAFNEEHADSMPTRFPILSIRVFSLVYLANSIIHSCVDVGVQVGYFH